MFDSYPGSIAGNRPLLLSRNGGMGNQRYPVGFSGDTFQHEVTLDFEIQTTPMAANVLFGYVLSLPRFLRRLANWFIFTQVLEPRYWWFS